MDGSPRHVAIVGAGFSGLRCADILAQNGFKVTIFEGRSRIGGRVHQIQLANGHYVDMGANWIHGSNGNIILDLARATDTGARPLDEFSCSFDEFGVKFPAQKGVKYETIMWGIIDEAFEYSKASGSEINPSRSLWDYFQERIPEHIPETEAEFEEDRRMMLQMCQSWGTFIGTRIERQSLKYFWLEECIDGENLFCSGSYRKILQHISDPVLNSASINIKFNNTVKTISYKTTDNNSISITLADDSTCEFDQVVVTTPLGWLQKNKATAFEPSLPPQLSNAIDAISHGCLEKVYISFPSAFWLSNEDESRNIKGFIQWLAPTYETELNTGRWPQEAFELAGMSNEDSHPTLLFYMYGDQSKWFTSELAKLRTKEEKMQLVIRFFQPYYSKLSNYSEESSACKPTECLATEWLNDDLAGNGSYGNFQVGLEQGAEAIQTMRRGLPEQGLWIAGEHTAQYEMLGTTAGAYCSGEAVAKRIVEHCSKTA